MIEQGVLAHRRDRTRERSNKEEIKQGRDRAGSDSV